MYDNEESVCGICYNGEYFYFQKNLQGDVIAIVDDKADVIAQYAYDAWGVCTVTSDTSACNIATINPYRYRGYYYDNEIRMYYLQSRYYNPTTSRFLNGDMAEVLGLAPLINDPTIFNLHVYCSNNPVTDSDSVGRLSEKQLANMFSITFVFEMFFALMLVDQPAALVKVGAYVMKIATPIATKAFWWKPWLIAAIVLAAVAIVVAGVLVLFNKYQKNLAAIVNKAHAKILATVKRTSKQRYWTATVKVGYVDIGRPITYSQAVKEVVAGRSVFTVTWFEAKAVALAAGGRTGKNNHTLFPEIDKGKENTKGFYWHYHTYNRKGGHVYYLF